MYGNVCSVFIREGENSMNYIEFDGLPVGVTLEINNTIVIGTAVPPNNEDKKKESA